MAMPVLRRLLTTTQPTAVRSSEPPAHYIPHSSVGAAADRSGDDEGSGKSGHPTADTSH